MGKRRHHFDHEPAGGGRVSAATVEDLAFAASALSEAERLRAEAAVALARVRARGDGEVAVGMPVTQHLRWTTNVRRSTVTTLGVISDVAGELGSVVEALDAGRITIDQAGAVAWPASKVSASRRHDLDAALRSDGMDGWTSLSPESLEAEVERLLDQLDPRTAEEKAEARSGHEYLHLQPTLDAQGLKGSFQVFGIDAVLLDATIRKAADSPTEGVPRRRQLLGGLLRLCDAWTGGRREDDAATGAVGAAVTIYAIIDERDQADGTGEFVATSAGLAPRLTPKQVRALRDDCARRIEVQVRDDEPVAVTGRAGHAIDDPTALSEDTIRILCKVRDVGCTMPGCDRPAEHLHHLIWKALAASRGQTAPDDPCHRASVCQRCHTNIHRHHWAGKVRPGGITWTRAGPARHWNQQDPASTTTPHRLTRRLRPAPPAVHLDHDGDPLPF